VIPAPIISRDPHGGSAASFCSGRAAQPAALDAHRHPDPGAECLWKRAWAGRCDADDQLHDLRGRTGGLPVRITLVVADPQLGRAHTGIAKPVPGWIFLESGTPDQGYLHPAVNAVHPVDVPSYSIWSFAVADDPAA